MALRAMPRWVAGCLVATLFVAPVGAGGDASAGSAAGADTPPGNDYSEFTLVESTRAGGSGMDGAGEALDGGFEQPETTIVSVDPDGSTVTTTTGVTVTDGTLLAQVSIEAVGDEFVLPTGSLGDATTELELCPDRRGLVHGRARVVAQFGSGDRRTTGMEVHRTFNIRFSGKVNDAAHLTDYYRDSGGSVTERDFDEGKETVRGASWSQESAYDFRSKRNRGGNLTVKPQHKRALPGDMEGRTNTTLENFDTILIGLLRDAEARWRSGYCVEIDVTKGQSGTVKPKKKVEIEAEPRSRFDHTTIDAPISAKLTAGKKKIDPKQQPSPPARFTYTGPDKTGESGAVELRSVSRRGIGTTTLTYDTAGDLKVDATAAASGGYPAHWTGTKCGGPAGTWAVQFQFTVPGFGPASGELTFTLDPQTLSGPLTGQSGGFAISGTASYDPATSMLSMTGPGTVTIPVQKGSFC